MGCTRGYRQSPRIRWKRWLHGRRSLSRSGEELFVTVGGFGDTNAQGFNGGGKAWTNVSGGSYGGGATDIRVGGTGHFNRILVAGGGGSSVRNYTGGYAGGVIGMDGTGSSGQFGTGASQSASGGGGISGSFGPGASRK
ncbi:glycine rich domain-containing protein [Erysipelothrix sp. D19-032]